MYWRLRSTSHFFAQKMCVITLDSCKHLPGIYLQESMSRTIRYIPHPLIHYFCFTMYWLPMIGLYRHTVPYFFRARIFAAVLLSCHYWREKCSSCFATKSLVPLNHTKRKPLLAGDIDFLAKPLYEAEEMKKYIN